jgi:hypothetical protein
MSAREYFPTKEDVGGENRDSVRLDEYAFRSKGLTSGRESGATNTGLLRTVEGIQLPQSMFASSSQQQHSEEDGAFQTTGIVEALEDPHPAQASWPDFAKYLFTDGNWTDLFATSASWMLLDFTFYLLGVNSSSFVPTMFGERIGSDQPPYRILISNERHIMESTSIGALLGCLIAIGVLHFYSRKKAQTYGFLILGGLFIIVGALYVTLPITNAHAAMVVFYGVCQLFFNLGKYKIQDFFCFKSIG